MCMCMCACALCMHVIVACPEDFFFKVSFKSSSRHFSLDLLLVIGVQIWEVKMCLVVNYKLPRSRVITKSYVLEPGEATSLHELPK